MSTPDLLLPRRFIHADADTWLSLTAVEAQYFAQVLSWRVGWQPMPVDELRREIPRERRTQLIAAADAHLAAAALLVLHAEATA